MSEAQDVTFEVVGCIGRIHLNRPQALNSLTREMCSVMHEYLDEWEANDAVRAVVVTAEGDRAFCAGGDIRKVTEAGRQDPIGARDFFITEYAMDAAIVDFPKPYICLIDGIVMGGGLGISVNGRYRVMSEKIMAAMPETGIGLLPDVGATAFLNAAPGRTGLYLGLTGHRLDAADAIHAGFGTHCVPSDRQETLLDALSSAQYLGDDFATVEGLINSFAADPGPSTLASRQREIDRLFAADKVEDIVAALESDGSDFAATCAKTLTHMSPTSLKITAKQLIDHPGISPKDALVLEYRMVCHVLQRHEFYEGVRAAVVDKDRNPQWKPATLEDVSNDIVNAHFESLGEAELSLN